MSCMIEDTRVTRIKPLAIGVLMVAVAASGVALFVLPSQSHAAMIAPPAPGTHLAPIAPPAMPVMPAQAAVSAPTPMATTAIPSTVLRSERIASLRVFGVTVFRYVTRIEGPRK